MAFASSIAGADSLDILREFDAERILCDVRKCQVGCGAFGRVFVGKDEKAGFVAVKSFPVKGGEHEQLFLEQKFCQEYSMLLQSRHDNISVVHGYTKWPGAIGIVMQFYGGGNLRVLLLNDLIELGHGLILRMATETASAVAYIHNCGTTKRLVHEDIKPENIFISHDLHCILGDFGCARLAKLTAAASTQLLGQDQPQGLTLYYAAPERLLEFARPKKEHDTYSCGMVYFVMLAREEPYQSENECKEKIRQGLRPNREVIRELKEESNEANREIVEVIEGAMVKCWDQDPKKRPDMVSIRDIFQQLLSKQDQVAILQQVAIAASNMHFVDPVATHNPTVPLHLLSSQSWQFCVAAPQASIDVLSHEHPQQLQQIPNPQSESNLPGNENIVALTPPPVQDISRPTPHDGLPGDYAALHSSYEAASAGPSRRAVAQDRHPNQTPDGEEVKLSAFEKQNYFSGFLAIGGNGVYGLHCTKYNVNTREHQDFPKLKFRRVSSTSAKVGNWVYVVGGRSCEKSCEMMDLGSRKHWTKAADANQLYVSGGVGEYQELSSCLIYDTDGDRWLESVPMSQPRSGHGMCSINNLLYCIGGNKKYGPSTSCEFRDVRERTFSPIAPLNNPTSCVACVARGGKLYAIGKASPPGIAEDRSLLEEYIPEANKWRFLTPLPSPRYSCPVCVIGNKIFVVGGQSFKFAEPIDLRTVDVYDPTSGAWTQWGVLEKSFAYDCIVAV